MTFILQKAIRPLIALQFTGNNIDEINKLFKLNLDQVNPSINFKDGIKFLNVGDWVIRITRGHFLYTRYDQSEWIISNHEFQKWFLIIDPFVMPTIEELIVED